MSRVASWGSLVARVARLGVVLVAAGCATAAPSGGRLTAPTASGAPAAPGTPGTSIELHRERAVIEEVVAVQRDAAGPIWVPLARGLVPGSLTVRARGDTAPRWREVAGDTPAIEVELADRSSAAAVVVRYATDHLRWRASYVLVEGARRARLDGAVVLDNATGRAWPQARLALAATGGHGDTARSLGAHRITSGPQRLALPRIYEGAPPRRRLMFDAVGAGLDWPRMAPRLEPKYGDRVSAALAAAAQAVLELDLDRGGATALAAGPVQLFAMADGRPVLRAAGELSPPPAGGRLVVIALGSLGSRGRAALVTGRRQRTDFVLDRARRRLVEELTVTLRNRGVVPVDVVVREHLYRGRCWTLAYQSSGPRAVKEGWQQVSLGVTVPAAPASAAAPNPAGRRPWGESRVMYRVVYEWDPRTCQPSTSAP